MTTHCALLIIDVQVAMFDEADPVYQGGTIASEDPGINCQGP